MEQVRRKTHEPPVQNRRTNALKHQHGGSGGGGAHPGAPTHPSALKNTGHINGVNSIGLTGGSASASNQPMSSKIANMSGVTSSMGNVHSHNPSGS